MQRWPDLLALDEPAVPSVVSIGVFDGVHRGHRVVLERAVRLAQARGLRSVVVTFDPHPMAVIRGAGPARLSDLDLRLDLLEQVGVNAAAVLRFDKGVAAMPAEAFAEMALHDRLGAVAVVVGENFRFGNRAAGDVGTLEALGFEVDAVPLAGDAGGERWSSTYVRSCLDAGDVVAASEALARRHRVTGPVVRGDARGRELGYPTANLGLAPETALPADGVYAGWLVRSDPAVGRPLLDGPRLPAAISVGTNPTFDGVARRVEAYVLDAGPVEAFDLYDEVVAVEFAARLRGQERFDSVEALITQMDDDVAATRRVL